MSLQNNYFCPQKPFQQQISKTDGLYGEETRNKTSILLFHDNQTSPVDTICFT
jgi:hypothetical protein